MANLTIRMEQDEKQRLFAWALSQGKKVTDYIKGLVPADEGQRIKDGVYAVIWGL